MKIIYYLILVFLVIVDLIAMYLFIDGKFINVGVKTISSIDLKNLLIFNIILIVILFVMRKQKKG